MSITLKQLKAAFEHSKANVDSKCLDCRILLFLPDEIQENRCERCFIKMKKEHERSVREFLQEDEDGWFDSLEI